MHNLCSVHQGMFGTKFFNRSVQGNSAVATAGESEHVFANTNIHRIVRISKTNQDIPNL